MGRAQAARGRKKVVDEVIAEVEGLTADPAASGVSGGALRGIDDAENVAPVDLTHIIEDMTAEGAPAANVGVGVGPPRRRSVVGDRTLCGSLLSLALLPPAASAVESRCKRMRLNAEDFAQSLRSAFHVSRRSSGP
jgi:hypothetical protein